MLCRFAYVTSFGNYITGVLLSSSKLPSCEGNNSKTLADTYIQNVMVK
jgi:hypothetical protein